MIRKKDVNRVDDRKKDVNREFYCSPSPKTFSALINYHPVRNYYKKFPETIVFVIFYGLFLAFSS